MPSFKLFTSEHKKHEISKLIKDLENVGADVEDCSEDGYISIYVDDVSQLNRIDKSLLPTGLVEI